MKNNRYLTFSKFKQAQKVAITDLNLAGNNRFKFSYQRHFKSFKKNDKNGIIKHIKW